jgi:hypothetical protein
VQKAANGGSTVFEVIQTTQQRYRNLERDALSDARESSQIKTLPTANQEGNYPHSTLYYQPVYAGASQSSKMAGLQGLTA